MQLHSQRVPRSNSKGMCAKAMCDARRCPLGAGIANAVNCCTSCGQEWWNLFMSDEVREIPVDMSQEDYQVNCSIDV